MDNNLNKGFYKDLDTNFAIAYDLCAKNFSKEELLVMLKTGNIPEKQIAALNLNCVTSIEEASLLLSNLTGCDGKIREAVALRIFSLCSQSDEMRKLFSSLDPKVFADATVDINANICRYVVDTVLLFKDNSTFAEKYSAYILNIAYLALEELDKFIFRDKKYVINKQLFKLYWCLEALKFFYEYISPNDLENLVKISIKQNEYTIREKVAQIIVNLQGFTEAKSLLKNDENYYVRVAMLNH